MDNLTLAGPFLDLQEISSYTDILIKTEKLPEKINTHTISLDKTVSSQMFCFVGLGILGCLELSHQQVLISL